MNKPVGPKYRTCQSCFTKPAVGVHTQSVGSAMVFTHLCANCSPAEAFELYRPPCSVCQVIHNGPECE